MTLISPNDITPYLSQLTQLLISCVDSDSSIGFIPPLTPTDANNYWQDVNEEVRQGSKIIFLMHLDQQVTGCVQLALISKENGLHRAEVEKLMVDKKYRGKGIAKQLMLTLESAAKQNQRSLLVLDTRKGDVASKLYLALDYKVAGEIPNFALSASNKLDTTVYFYKELS